MNSYIAAMFTSIIVGLTVRRVFNSRVKGLQGARLHLFNSFSSLLAISSAGFLNSYMIRQTELSRGIDIFDPA